MGICKLLALACLGTSLAAASAVPVNEASRSTDGWGQPWWPSSSHGPCLTDKEAQHVSDGWFLLTGGQGSFNATVGNALLTDDFLDYSGSIASVINGGKTGPMSLLGPSFNKTSFLEANANQPPTPYKQLGIWHTCNTIFERFVAELSPQPALGISIFEVVPSPQGNAYGPWQIKTTYGELNGIAFLADQGYTFVPPS